MEALKIEMPDGDVTHTFTSFNKAIKFCETEFGYGKTIGIVQWKDIKKSKSLSTLNDFLWYDGLWTEYQND